MKRRSMPFGWRTELARGITWDRQRARWTARVMRDGRLVVVGRYVDLTTAVDERMKAEAAMAGAHG